MRKKILSTIMLALLCTCIRSYLRPLREVAEAQRNAAEQLPRVTHDMITLSFSSDRGPETRRGTSDNPEVEAEVEYRSWLCSPVFAPDTLLKALPPTYIAAAGFGPFSA